MNVLQLKSASAMETQNIGRLLGEHLVGGDVVLLEGELGAGKTTLAQGLARGLGVPPTTAITSPTFTILHEYEGKMKLFHFDWYRLPVVQGEDEEESLECLGDKDAVCVIEWPERGRRLLPENAITVHLDHKGLSERQIRIDAPGKSRETLRESLRKKSR